ncbi:MAG: 5-(carboxyamino)imidazole ribonucleotide synthase [Gemmatimonadota bacterium]
MSQPILPGAHLGVLGGGQLGRMFALAARRMGYRVAVFAPEDDTPTGQVADRAVQAPYEDLDAVRRFASEVSVITFEFENVPADTAAAAADVVPVRPAGSLLHTAQHRRREKEAVAAAGVPTVAFAVIESAEDLEEAISSIGTPSILKTSASGYDGKGQAKILRPEDAADAWAGIGRAPAVLEAFAHFEREISVVGARGLDGEVALYEPFENIHENHILDVTLSPARIDERTRTRALDIARTLLDAWDVVGVVCFEFFDLGDGELVVNELAPRPHNSGHLTIDGHVCSQFELQVRAVCGLPLGSTDRVAPSVMVNLLGDLWANGEPNWAAAAAIPGVALHLYGKGAARPGRKMGHLTAVAPTVEDAHERALRARSALTG